MEYVLSTELKEMEIYYRKQLLKQKDDLIDNLNDTINTVIHISLLHEINSFKIIVAPSSSATANYSDTGSKVLTDEKNH